jgi:aerobic-type carbon monoxide dehydrogenase small subunit (CoxS/CutS family)
MRFTLNGARRAVTAHPMKRLLDVLREDCGLTVPCSWRALP